MYPFMWSRQNPFILFLSTYTDFGTIRRSIIFAFSFVCAPPECNDAVLSACNSVEALVN